MSAEAAHILEQALTVRNQASEGELRVKARRFLNCREREARQDELDHIENTLSRDNIAAKAVNAEARKDLIRRRTYLKKDLAQNAPPTDLKGETRDALLKKERELKDLIRVGMPPRENQWRNPVGAVDAHMKWEKANKDRILAWKNLRRLNNPDDESKDLSNVEILRPYLTQAGAPASFMADAQLPGAMSYGHIPDENWKETFGNLYPESSPLAEKEKEELQAKIRELEGQLQKKETVKKSRQANMVKVRAAKGKKQVEEYTPTPDQAA